MEKQTRRHSIRTAMTREALRSALREGLLSGHEMAKRPDLLALARPDSEARKEWLDRYAREKSDSYRSVHYAGPSVFFGPPDKKKVTKDHYINKWGLVPLRIDYDKLKRDDPSAKIIGAELFPHTGKITPGRRRDLTDAEVDTFRRTKARDLWRHYKDTAYYAADVPHGFLVTSSGKVEPKYLRAIKEKTSQLAFTDELSKIAIAFSLRNAFKKRVLPHAQDSYELVGAVNDLRAPQETDPKKSPKAAPA